MLISPWKICFLFFVFCVWEVYNQNISPFTRLGCLLEVTVWCLPSIFWIVHEFSTHLFFMREVTFYRNKSLDYRCMLFSARLGVGWVVRWNDFVSNYGDKNAETRKKNTMRISKNLNHGNFLCYSIHIARIYHWHLNISNQKKNTTINILSIKILELHWWKQGQKEGRNISGY